MRRLQSFIILVFWDIIFFVKALLLTGFLLIVFGKKLTPSRKKRTPLKVALSQSLTWYFFDLLAIVNCLCSSAFERVGANHYSY